MAEKIQNILRDYRQQFSKKQVRNTRQYIWYTPNYCFQPSKVEYITAKKDACDEVGLKMVPDDVLTCVRHDPSFLGLKANDTFKYMARTMNSPDELWRMRKQFALQIASSSFMTYTFFLSSRQPSRFQISRKTGFIAMTELLPGNTPSLFDLNVVLTNANSICSVDCSPCTSYIHFQ